MDKLENQVLAELKDFRRELHSHPEISGEEEETSKRVIEFIQKCQPSQIVKSLGGFGIAATFKGESPGKHIMLRAELDALPIHEINDFSYRSKYDGKGHKCGHDGHTTILCAVAKILSNNSSFKGKVTLLFQPAEENGMGANAILEDPQFADLKPDYIFALHNLPGYALNEIVCKEGDFSAAVETILIDLKGKTAHAAESEKGINPAMAMSEIIQVAKQLEDFEAGGSHYKLITPVHFQLGKEAYGISAGEAHMAFTLRSDTNDAKVELSNEFEKRSRSIGESYNLKVNIDRQEVFSAIENNATMNDAIISVANKMDLKFQVKNRPFRWGEDFGLFTEKIPGAMFGLGAGENVPALHNPDYDFPDELIESGAEIFYSIINKMNE